MNYKFKEVSRNQWQLKHYTFDAPDEIDINKLLERTKSEIFKEV
jgi:hypothetical protein